MLLHSLAQVSSIEGSLANNLGVVGPVCKRVGAGHRARDCPLKGKTKRPPRRHDDPKEVRFRTDGRVSHITIPMQGYGGVGKRRGNGGSGGSGGSGKGGKKWEDVVASRPKSEK